MGQNTSRLPPTEFRVTIFLHYSTVCTAVKTILICVNCLIFIISINMKSSILTNLFFFSSSKSGGVSLHYDQWLLMKRFWWTDRPCCITLGDRTYVSLCIKVNIYNSVSFLRTVWSALEVLIGLVDFTWFIKGPDCVKRSLMKKKRSKSCSFFVI